MHFLLHAKKSCGCLRSPRSGLCQPCGTLSAKGRLSEAALASEAVAHFWPILNLQCSLIEFDVKV